MTICLCCGADYPDDGDCVNLKTQPHSPKIAVLVAEQYVLLGGNPSGPIDRAILADAIGGVRASMGRAAANLLKRMEEGAAMDTIAIYVLPTEEGLPPRAVIGPVNEEDDTVSGEIATWSRDSATWMMDARPVPPSLAEAITEHAKSLGVEW